jgi:RNA polymerase-interacting CarD/CdnL/TRCF family regulator
MEQTTIQISKELLEKLRMRKMTDKESYEDILWNLLEDTMELSDEAKRRIAISRQQYKEGKVVSWDKLKRELKLNV